MSGLVRIIIHWTAGGPKASVLDKQDYHFLYQADGAVVAGALPPEENIRVNDHIYGAHTFRLNTGSIGVSFCGMAGAIFSPFSAGRYPLNMPQIEAGCRHVAGLAKHYGIPIDRKSILTHAEVQPTLGVKQRGKWDIRWLPGMTDVGDAVEVGDKLRDIIRAAR
jgi:hypothetical protein